MGSTEAGLRPVDLARMAGVSTQLIRNYADAGILPPAPRTPSGYRTFGSRHRRALLTYGVLTRGYGPGTAQAIMQAVHAKDLGRALALVDAGHAALHEQRLSLKAASEALEALAGQAPDDSAVPRSGLRIGEVAALLGVRTSALRVGVRRPPCATAGPGHPVPQLPRRRRPGRAADHPAPAEPLSPGPDSAGTRRSPSRGQQRRPAHRARTAAGRAHPARHRDARRVRRPPRLPHRGRAGGGGLSAAQRTGGLRSGAAGPARLRGPGPVSAAPCGIRGTACGARAHLRCQT